MTNDKLAANPVPGDAGGRAAIEALRDLADAARSACDAKQHQSLIDALAEADAVLIAHAAPAPSDGVFQSNTVGRVVISGDDPIAKDFALAVREGAAARMPKASTEPCDLLMGEPSTEAGVPAGMVLVPVEPTRAWASTMANIRQGRSSTPRCEPPSEANIQWARERIAEVLEAAKTLAAYTPKQATPTDEVALGERLTHAEWGELAAYRKGIDYRDNTKEAVEARKARHAELERRAAQDAARSAPGSAAGEGTSS